MNLKQELQQLTNKLDKSNRKLAAAKARKDYLICAQATTEIEELTNQIKRLKGQKDQQLHSEVSLLRAMPFHRDLTKIEQADMGALKKSVRGIIIVHPLTALGRALNLEKVTGYASQTF